MDSRNRLWWVMGGVALLLVVVLTGGLYWLRPVDSVARADLALPRPRQDAQPFEYVAVPGASVASAPEAAPDAAPAPAEDAAARSQPLPAHQPRPRVTLDTQAPASPAATPEVRAIATTNARSGAAPAVAAPAIATPAAEVKRSVPLAKLAPKSPLHEFWVQVGSFASRARATALEQRLSDPGHRQSRHHPANRYGGVLPGARRSLRQSRRGAEISCLGAAGGWHGRQLYLGSAQRPRLIRPPAVRRRCAGDAGYCATRRATGPPHCRRRSAPGAAQCSAATRAAGDRRC